MALQNNDRLFFAPMIEYYIEAERWKSNFRVNPKFADIEQLYLNAIFTQLGILQSENFLNSEDLRNLIKQEPDQFLEKLEKMVTYNYEKPHFHVTYINKTRLSNWFSSNGFSSFYVSGYCQSSVPMLRYIDSLKASYVHHNIYFEGQK